MSEIKFRARNNKCWIYCDAIINGWAILNENGGMAKINPETVRTVYRTKR